MSEENVAIIRAAFQAFERADMDGVLGLCDENIEITQAIELIDAPRHQHGHAGVLDAFGIWPDLWDDYRVEIVRVLDVGEEVMVATINRGRGKDSGAPVEMPFTFLFSVRGGKITEWRLFMHEEQALNAIGLAE
jgi:ketosteroid isomerase-like protein